MNGVRTVHDHDFRSVVLGSTIPVVVGFCASWSVACEPLGGVLDEIAAAVDWLGVVRLDVDTAPLTAGAYRVGSVPSVLVFNRGGLLVALPGVPAATTILAIVSAALPAPARPTIEPA